MAEAALAVLGGARFKRKPSRSGATHRTGAPVRRDSIEAGTFEDAFFSRPSKGETDRIYKRAAALSAGRANLRARIAHEEREPTPREAAILRFSRNTLAVLEALLRIARVQAGRVYPTLEYLAETVGIGRRTVTRLILAADRDLAGRRAVARSIEQYASDTLTVVPDFPPAPYKDWAEVLEAKERGGGGRR